MLDTQPSVLIVDDDASLRLTLTHVLGSAGYQVRSVDGVFAALSQIREDVPDILLSDLNMPGLSGFELLSVVRRCFPGIVVVAMSGAYFGDGIPTGVMADAFFEKGRGAAALIDIVGTVASRQAPQTLSDVVLYN